MSRIASFVGWSDTGKTTVVSKVVAALSMGGADVATVKKTNHHLPRDKEGSDTDRFSTAGSRETALVGPESGRIHIYHEIDSEYLLHLFENADYIISEGLFFPGEPCLEIVGARSNSEGPKRSPEEISAYLLAAGSGPPPFTGDTHAPIIPLDDTDKIIALLEELWNEK
ncbi:MAG: molybdopterin-guanine dinucleotide biosynthesis protein MobB [Spirochaetaceae bacterium]